MIKIIDNFLPEEEYDDLIKSYSNLSLNYGWKSNKNTDPHGHWNYNISKTGPDNLANITSRLPKKINEIWEHVKNKEIMVDNHALLRCYINGHTYGNEGYFHTDSKRNDEVTIVIYLCDKWNLDWAGETCFSDEKMESIIFAASPKKNRAVVFPSNLPHCARAVSRKFLGLRKTLMFKSRTLRTPNFEKLSSFLFENNALNFKHKDGTLHDHLVRVYQLLEKKGLPEYVCFGGGLHSVFGTNAFTKQLFTEENNQIIIDTFGYEAFGLAKLFSKAKRPKTLEEVNIMQDGYALELNDGSTTYVDSNVFNNLRMIECANLEDQNSLNMDKYPNLCEVWK